VEGGLLLLDALRLMAGCIGTDCGVRTDVLRVRGCGVATNADAGSR
jgi:hypothetical protein